MITLTLRCDYCAAAITGHDGITPANLRRLAKRSGWRRAKQSSGTTCRYLDLCPTHAWKAIP